jgi:homoserine kinase
LAEVLTVAAPATSANLGPGFDVLGVALDLGNAITVRRRPGPLGVVVRGEGEGELPEDATNLVCRALASGLGDLDGLEVECRNRIPLARGLGSSAAAICAGLVAANALGALRWTPDDLLARATELDGHADNVAACILGGMVAALPGPRAAPVPLAAPLAFVLVIPAERLPTSAARRVLPAAVPLATASETLARAVGLTLALGEGRIDDLPDLLHDTLHEPHRAPLVPGLDVLRALAGREGCLGVTISGSGPATLLWCREGDADALAVVAERALAGAGVDAAVRPARVSPSGVRARWKGGAGLRLERSVG